MLLVMRNSFSGVSIIKVKSTDRSVMLLKHTTGFEINVLYIVESRYHFPDRIQNSLLALTGSISNDHVCSRIVESRFL